MNERLRVFRETLSVLLDNVEEDCPVEVRTRHLTAAMREARTLLQQDD